MSSTGWAGLEPAAPLAPEAEADAQALARAAARIFRGRDGELLLSHLRAMTLERCLGPDASDAMLRSLEGQRQLVLHLAALIERGRNEK